MQFHESLKNNSNNFIRLIFFIYLANVAVRSQACHDWNGAVGDCATFDECLDGNLHADYSGNCRADVVPRLEKADVI